MGSLESEGQRPLDTHAATEDYEGDYGESYAEDDDEELEPSSFRLGRSFGGEPAGDREGDGAAIGGSSVSDILVDEDEDEDDYDEGEEDDYYDDDDDDDDDDDEDDDDEEGEQDDDDDDEVGGGGGREETGHEGEAGGSRGHRASSSFDRWQQHSNFAPPFYGRPPTPLPPSPSLTSLLRPSRPTTPDATDEEMEPPVPRAAPQVPTYEYYGFVLYLFSSLAFLIYLLWSYLPSPFLHGLGIYYYPNRWWSLAIPSFLVIALVYTYVALASYNTEILTLPLDSIETIVDGAAKMAAIDERGRVVVVGGPDGHRLHGKKTGPEAGGSGARTTNPRPEKKQQQQAQSQPSSLASSYSVWPSLPWASTKTATPYGHSRQPSSPPSPSLGEWPDRGTGGGRSGGGGGGGGRHSSKSKAKQGKRGGRGAGKGGGKGGKGGGKSGKSGKGKKTEDWGLVMGNGRRSWRGRADGRAEAGGAARCCTQPDWKCLWSEGTDAVMDIPLAGVCEVLYA